MSIASKILEKLEDEGPSGGLRVPGKPFFLVKNGVYDKDEVYKRLKGILFRFKKKNYVDSIISMLDSIVPKLNSDVDVYITAYTPSHRQDFTLDFDKSGYEFPKIFKIASQVFDNFKGFISNPGGYDRKEAEFSVDGQLYTIDLSRYDFSFTPIDKDINIDKHYDHFKKEYGIQWSKGL